MDVKTTIFINEIVMIIQFRVKKKIERQKRRLKAPIHKETSERPRPPSLSLAKMKTASPGPMCLPPYIVF